MKISQMVALAVLVLILGGGAYYFYKTHGSVDHVMIEDLRLGEGPLLEKGTEVTVHYVTRVRNGPIISESRKSGQPFTFIVGAGQVMKGWEEGIRGLRVGGFRKILIPPQDAYGERGVPNVVPPNATLEVEIELLAVRDAPPLPPRPVLPKSAPAKPGPAKPGSDKTVPAKTTPISSQATKS